MHVYDFTEKDAKKAGEIEAELLKKGKMIDLEDIMLAGVALLRNEKVLTLNAKHFENIEDLELENLD